MFNEMMSGITKGHAHTEQDNGGVRAFWVQNYSIRFAKPFDACVAKPFDLQLQNRSMRVSKPFDPRCKTIRSMFPNHLICVAKPFEPCCQTI